MKRITNLYLEDDVVDACKRSGINMSKTCNDYLKARLEADYGVSFEKGLEIKLMENEIEKLKDKIKAKETLINTIEEKVKVSDVELDSIKEREKSVFRNWIKLSKRAPTDLKVDIEARFGLMEDVRRVFSKPEYLEFFEQYQKEVKT